MSLIKMLFFCTVCVTGEGVLFRANEYVYLQWTSSLGDEHYSLISRRSWLPFSVKFLISVSTLSDYNTAIGCHVLNRDISSCGILLCVLRICLILLRAYSPPDIFDLQLSICSCQFRFSSISRPWNLTHLTRLIIVLFKCNTCVSDLTFLFFYVLLIFKDNLFTLNHSANDAVSWLTSLYNSVIFYQIHKLLYHLQIVYTRCTRGILVDHSSIKWRGVIPIRIPGVHHKLWEIILNQYIYNWCIVISLLDSSWTTPRQHRVCRNSIMFYINVCDLLYQRP